MINKSGITMVELVVIACIAGILIAIAIPKFMDTVAKDKIWDGMSTLMTYESSQLAYLAHHSRLGSVDSIGFKPHTSEYFAFEEQGTGEYKAIARVKMGKFKPGRWLATRVDTAGGLPRLHRSCSPGDSAIVKHYVYNYFRK